MLVYRQIPNSFSNPKMTSLSLDVHSFICVEILSFEVSNVFPYQVMVSKLQVVVNSSYHVHQCHMSLCLTNVSALNLLKVQA
jgi:hypothetical protein